MLRKAVPMLLILFGPAAPFFVLNAWDYTHPFDRLDVAGACSQYPGHADAKTISWYCPAHAYDNSELEGNFLDAHWKIQRETPVIWNGDVVGYRVDAKPKLLF